MSRVGKKPIVIPRDVAITVTNDNVVSVIYKNTNLFKSLNKLVSIKITSNILEVFCRCSNICLYFFSANGHLNYY